MVDDINQKTDAWILDSLAGWTDPRQRRWASLLLGLGGTVIFALLSCVVVGFLAMWMLEMPHRNAIERTAAGLLTFIVGCGSYVATLLALQLVATCQLPMSIRLILIYGICFLGWLAATWSAAESTTATQVLWLAPLCLGGLVQHAFYGWRFKCWNQPIAEPKFTIFSLLDVTTAIALTLALASAHQGFDTMGLVRYVIAVILFALLGMQVWARLAYLSTTARRRDTGFSLWMAFNLLLAFLVFLLFAVAGGNSPTGLVGFISAPITLFVMHAWTEIPLRWLRGCGWTLVSTSDIKTSA